jgi:cytochrome P450
LRETDFEDVLGFVFGTHRCLADKFPKVHLEITLAKLFLRCPALKLAGDGEVEFTGERVNTGVTRMMVLVE